jgi:outer membrane protein OmpA-like peptidoglycan-associated protein
MSSPTEEARKQTLREEGKGGQRDRENLNKLQKQLEKALGRMIEQDLIAVKRTGRGLEVEINTSILFDSGKALIQARAVNVLTEIAAAIKDFPNAVQVEGFTDNIPIETAIYPSNWELSAGRAASVVHLFSDEGVDPFRMSAIGFGEFRPVASNKTSEGRERNRRVVVVIMSEAASKLYDKEQVIEITPESKRVQNIDLDEPPPLVEIPLMGPEVDVPAEGFPQELPLRGRGNSSSNPDEQDRLMTIMETVEGEGDSQGGEP